MKVRIKFAKEGMMKFIGHLDIMRYFQKAIRRAELPIAYSEGFSPHMILSFAAPLGVGITSLGEYFDMELTREMPTEEIRRRLDQEMVEGMRVLSARRVPDGKASKAMSLVAAADYRILFREGRQPSGGWKEKAAEFFAQESIVIWRKTKRSEKETDIRPWIYQAEIRGEQIYLHLAAGSVQNLKPDLVMEAFCKFCGIQEETVVFSYHRLEMYAESSENKAESAEQFVTLESLGEEICSEKC